MDLHIDMGCISENFCSLPGLQFILQDFDNFWYSPSSVNLRCEIILLDIENFWYSLSYLGPHPENYLAIFRWNLIHFARYRYLFDIRLIFKPLPQTILIDMEYFRYKPSPLQPHPEFILQDFDNFWYSPSSVNLHCEIILLDFDNFSSSSYFLNPQPENHLLDIDNDLILFIFSEFQLRIHFASIR